MIVRASSVAAPPAVAPASVRSQRAWSPRERIDGAAWARPVHEATLLEVSYAGEPHAERVTLSDEALLASRSFGPPVLGAVLRYQARRVPVPATAP